MFLNADVEIPNVSIDSRQKGYYSRGLVGECKKKRREYNLIRQFPLILHEPLLSRPAYTSIYVVCRIEVGIDLKGNDTAG